MNFLQGRKTYIVAIIMIIFAVSGFLSGSISQDQAIQTILSALGLGALRAGIANK